MHTSATWLMALMLSLSTQVAAQHKHSHAHEHGVVRLDVAVQGESLTVNLDAPLDSLVGFERAPRNDKERQAADEVLARLKSGAGLFNGDASAQCTLSKAEVKAPVLEAGATAKGGHADLEASYEFRCTLPAQLRTLDLGLFEAFKRIQRIDVQVAGARGQVKVTLRRPARSVRLVR